MYQKRFLQSQESSSALSTLLLSCSGNFGEFLMSKDINCIKEINPVKIGKADIMTVPAEAVMPRVMLIK